MKVINCTDEKSLLVKGKMLLLELNQLTNVYSYSVVKYFEELIQNEEISVLTNKDFEEYMTKSYIFYQIAKHNIIRNTIYTLNQTSLVDQSRLLAEISNHSLHISYFEDVDKSFKVFDSYFPDKLKDNDKADIDIFNTINKTDENDIQMQVTNVTTSRVLNNYGIKFKDKELTKSLSWIDVHKAELIKK